MRRDLSKELAWLRRDLAAHMWRDLAKAFASLWRACLRSEGLYRPDLHYMRGPGPARDAKYDHLTSSL
jgi:hypothetical protein